MIAGTSPKRHLELLNTIKIGLARIGVEAHVPHVPYERGLEGVDFGNRAFKLGYRDLTLFDVNVGNKSKIEIASLTRTVPCGNLAHFRGCEAVDPVPLLGSLEG